MPYNKIIDIFHAYKLGVEWRCIHKAGQPSREPKEIGVIPAAFTLRAVLQNLQRWWEHPSRVLEHALAVINTDHLAVGLTLKPLLTESFAVGREAVALGDR